MLLGTSNLHRFLMARVDRLLRDIGVDVVALLGWICWIAHFRYPLVKTNIAMEDCHLQ